MSGRRVRRRLLVPLAVLAVAGGGWAAYAQAAGTGHHYRLAVARVGDVSATVDLSGTVSATGRADLVAGASGKVVAVPVQVGQQVRRGQVVARLDQTALIAEGKAARASLAKARAQLASDEDAQTSSVTSTSTTTATTSARTTARTTGSPAPILATIKKDQAAVMKAQTTASTALTTATEALQTEQSACAATSSSSPSPSASDTASDAPTASASSTPQVSDDCQSALGAVQSAQAAVAVAQDDLKTALDALTADLATALEATGSSASPSAPSSPSTRTPSTSSSGGTTVTAATLARDQASIDQARADLVSALAARRAAVVRAPSAGQLRSLSVARGDAVAAGDDVAVIVGKGLATVEIEATQAQAAELRVGGPASVTPAGATTALVGRVARIAHVPTTSTSSSSSTGTTTYAVQVTLTGKDESQPPLGMPVAVSAVIGTARHVVTVPASAVSDGAVEVLRSGTATRTRVTTGVVGASTIEVLSGVSAGDQVVLADLDEDLPTSDSSTTRLGGSGGFGGSGSFGGGTVGGPPGMG